MSENSLPHAEHWLLKHRSVIAIFFVLILSLFALYSALVIVDQGLYKFRLPQSPSDWAGIIVTIAVIWINYFLYHSFSIKNYNRHALAYGPETLTTIGILGCFGGILIALLELNTDDITKSIPALMVGIRTGFFSSISGIAGAVAIRLQHRYGKAQPSQDLSQPKSGTLDDLIRVTNEQMMGMRQDIAMLCKAIIGTEQGTLLTEITLLRSNNNDRQDRLREEFIKFKEHMVENTQKSIIEALEKVMRDFNTNLTTQFGENFKQLNEAVKLLVTWQENYKNELTDIKNYQQEAAISFHNASDQFKDTVANSESFLAIANGLDKTLQLLDGRIETINQQERALVDVLSSMQNITPEFKQKIDLLIDSLQKGVENVHDTMKASADETRIAMIDIFAGIRKDLDKNQTDISSHLKQSLDLVYNSVQALDKALAEELNKSLSGLGTQLAALSRQFVADYTPLTNELRRVVRIADEIRASDRNR